MDVHPIEIFESKLQKSTSKVGSFSVPTRHKVDPVTAWIRDLDPARRNRIKVFKWSHYQLKAADSDLVFATLRGFNVVLEEVFDLAGNTYLDFILKYNLSANNWKMTKSSGPWIHLTANDSRGRKLPIDLNNMQVIHFSCKQVTRREASRRVRESLFDECVRMTWSHGAGSARRC